MFREIMRLARAVVTLLVIGNFIYETYKFDKFHANVDFEWCVIFLLLLIWIDKDDYLLR